MADPIHQCSHRPPLGSSAPSIVPAAWCFSSTKYSNLQFRFQTCSESTLSFTIDVVNACSCHKYFLSWRNENCPKILRGHLYQYHACPSGQDLVATLSLIEVAKTFQHTLLAGSNNLKPVTKTLLNLLEVTMLWEHVSCCKHFHDFIDMKKGDFLLLILVTYGELLSLPPSGSARSSHVLWDITTSE